MQFLLIWNPIAGRGRAESRVKEFMHALEQRGHSIELVVTKAEGEARKLGETVSSDLDCIVIAGGDGTVNEVLNGLSDPSKVPLLHFPVGTANQLARTLGLPFEPQDLARIAEAGRVLRIDMGLVGDRRFLLLVSAGFDARVTELVKESRTDRLGYSGYVFPVLKALAHHQAQKVHVVIDEGERLSGYQVMALKMSHYGGIFSLAEDARLDSGQFVVCVLQEPAMTSWCRLAIAGLVGRTADCPGVILRTAKQVSIESAEPVPVEIDGDYFGMTPVTVQLEPSVVPVVIPVNGNTSNTS
jgi:YegS/Rv2252/BmrU family lipid kinase